MIFLQGMYYGFDSLDAKSDFCPNLRLALHGKKCLAGTFRDLCSADELQEILCATLDRVQNYYLRDEYIPENRLEYLPDYVTCCSALISELDGTSNDQMSVLQQSAIVMAKSYPKISQMHHNFIIDSLRLTFLNLYKKGNTKLFNVFIEKFVYNSLIWSCSYPPDDFDNEKSTNYKDFVPLWKSIFSLKLQYSKIDPADFKEIAKRLFNEFITSLFVFTTKLNLNIITEENENHINQKPEKTDDILTFLNMVEIFKEILTIEYTELFQPWIKKFARYVIKKSLHSPTISGYYKLLCCCLKMSDHCVYFENFDKKEDTIVHFQMISDFLEGVIAKIQQFTGDLQVACLLLILEAPNCFIRTILPIVAPVFEVSIY